MSDSYVEPSIERVGGSEWEAEPVEPLVIKDVGKREAPQYGACMTWNIPQSGIGANQPVSILQRRRTRSKGSVSIVALTGATAVMFNAKMDPLTGLNPQGATFVAIGTRVLEWESQQPLYAIAIGGTATVTVIDEAYAER